MNKLTSEGSCVLNLWQAMIPRSSPKVNPAMYEFQGAEYWTCYLGPNAQLNNNYNNMAP